MARSVPQIIEEAKTKAVADAAGVALVNVRMWKRRGRIPPQHWSALQAHEIATLDELAEAERERAA